MSSREEQLDILVQRRHELIEYVVNNDLTKENHIMKLYELQDVNLEIIKLNLDYKFENTLKKEWWQK